MYKALNYWVFGGFDGQKTPYEFIDWAAAKGLDGVELTVGECLKPEITEAEMRRRHNVRDAVRDRLPRQFQRRLQVGGAVVDARENMAVDVDHGTPTVA